MRSCSLAWRVRVTDLPLLLLQAAQVCVQVLGHGVHDAKVACEQRVPSWRAAARF